MNTSPYGTARSEWRRITEELVKSHPLAQADLLSAVLDTWDTLWQTTLGTGQLSVSLADIVVPATVVGYFFEILFTRELERRQPGRWRGNRRKDEKDLVYVPDRDLSVEIKASGQLGYKVYGNRSYGQKADNDLLVKKEKSGYYITINFYGHALTLVRFGWIDGNDWRAQNAPTGQMAGLDQSVYDLKLIAIPGSYRQRAPVILLNGVGPALAAVLAELGVHTIGDLLRWDCEPPSVISGIIARNRQFLDECVD